MPELTLHLQETFDDDSVIVRVNGVERERLEGVTTRLLLGYAKVLTLAIDDGPNRVEVELPRRDVKASAQVVGPLDADLEVRFSDGRLTLHIPADPPAYL